MDADAGWIETAPIQALGGVGNSALPSLKQAILNLDDSSLIVAQLAQNAQHHIDRMAELKTLRKAKERVAIKAAQGSVLLAPTTLGNDDVVRLAAYRDDTLFKLEALELAHGREFRQDLRLAVKLAGRAQRKNTRPELPTLPEQFGSEKCCTEYLRSWQCDRLAPCPACGARSAYFIVSRAVLECESCRRQRSIREDTIFSGSHLSLRTWFAAVQAVMACPDATSSELAAHLGISRVETARKMRSAILSALESADRSLLLAGLDREFGLDLPEPSAQVFDRDDACNSDYLDLQNSQPQ